jgi:hypothetical protein
VLNLCRILYSLQEGEVVVSKRFSGQWAPLIQAAQRDYDEAATEADLQLLSAHAVDFLAFARQQMGALRPAD